METSETELVNFPTSYQAILDRIEALDPVNYATTRNFIDGAVSYLSPYISRGVISTQLIMTALINKGYDFYEIEKFIQELAWRDYWQRVWQAKETDINFDLRHPQKQVRTNLISSAILDANTGIKAVDKGITHLYETGYLHNHLRMYVASIACNMGRNQWRLPAQWMYYHLLDADWASNALSWQWVAGSNSNKKYYANQENVNTYCRSSQKDTFMDVDYAAFDSFEVPSVLIPTKQIELKTSLPQHPQLHLTENLPSCIYNAYNLDPMWLKNLNANRILLLEPSHFDAYPMSGKSIEFIISLAQNVPGIQVYVGEFSELSLLLKHDVIHYKEHPLNSHYKGAVTSRDWMTSIDGYYPSFFKFWKQSKRELIRLFEEYGAQ